MKQSTNSKLVFLLIAIALPSMLTVNSVKAVTKNGSLFNSSSHDVWITYKENGVIQTVKYVHGNCSSILRQDLQAIWGKYCTTKSYSNQTWMVPGGYFWLTDKQIDGLPKSYTNVLINGYEVGRGWGASPSWPAPTMDEIDYVLVR